ncbi:MAG: hypothetical protein ACLPKE_31825 [Streptosporangiaceae bacterium]
MTRRPGTGLAAEDALPASLIGPVLEDVEERIPEDHLAGRSATSATIAAT